MSHFPRDDDERKEDRDPGRDGDRKLLEDSPPVIQVKGRIAHRSVRRSTRREVGSRR